MLQLTRYSHTLSRTALRFRVAASFHPYLHFLVSQTGHLPRSLLLSHPSPFCLPWPASPLALAPQACYKLVCNLLHLTYFHVLAGCERARLGRRMGRPLSSILLMEVSQP